MNKLTQPVPEDEEDFGPEQSDAEMEAWIARNRDGINALIREAREDIAEGGVEPWDFEAMLAEARREFEKSQKG
ncbi:hypothetical protein [Caulobacter sp. BK020]|uniref:hypothetical protein n=1 Tax=Caulobacter sp. BK020 TaxID=2512117 RepID=UPI00104453A3|nr:hypothetical protein [Caulobacter sp. BK020]TCS12089.1 antitoxin ParD1/3/4 [Caulobacter sp. BK020]